MPPERHAVQSPLLPAGSPVVLGVALLQFLAELRDHNHRDWMRQHAERHRTEVVDPLLRLLQRVVARVGTLIPGFGHPAPRTCLLRVQRDARFVGKHAPFWVRSGLQIRHRASVPGAPAPAVTLHLEPGACRVSVGLPRAASGSMASIRAAMVARPDLFEAVVHAVAAGVASWAGAPDRRLTGLERRLPHLAPHLGRRCQAATWQLTDHQVGTADLSDVVVRAVLVGLPLLRYQCLALGLDPGPGDLVRHLRGAEARVFLPGAVLDSAGAPG